MATQIEAHELTVGTIIVDGIASRVENVISLDMDNQVYVTIKDANGFTSFIRLNNYAEVTKLDWTEKKWEEFSGLLESW